MVHGLGLLLVGAILHSPLAAQVRDTIPRRRDTLAIRIPPGADSLLRDSLARRDSLLAAAARDTIKAPMTRAEHPVEIGIAQTLRWNRDSIFTTGAVTLADLLERVPGVTTFHAGWIAAPASAAYLGDFRQVRVFFDGFEVPVLDPRTGGVLDLTQINIWGAEEVAIEQAPEEIRVYIRTWRVRSTTPETRTDVSTGDQQTNLYRGYFGRRYRDGAALQFGAQQFGTTPPRRFGNSADQLGVLARVGWSNPRLSIDAFATYNSRHRGDIFGDFLLDTVPTVESKRIDAYLRVGTGDPDTSRVWAQVMAVGSSYRYTGVRSDSLLVPTTPAESLLVFGSLDTAAYRSQYVATAGVNRGRFRLSATGRMYGGDDQRIIIPEVRASFVSPALVLSARAQGRGIDSVTHLDVTAQLTPLPFVSLVGAVGHATNSQSLDSTFSTTYARGEAGVRLFKLWFVGGVLWRDSTRVLPPVVFDTRFAEREAKSVTAVTAAIRGQLWGPIYTDVSAVFWNDSTRLYRPRYQTRSEVFIRTNLAKRFPSGDFGLLLSGVHEYRSGVAFPVNGFPNVVVAGYRTISTLVEIRILRATLSWQFRNVLGERYAQVPFLIMPRQTNFYGVRWEFFN